eukprot:gene11799-8110_t
MCCQLLCVAVWSSGGIPPPGGSLGGSMIFPPLNSASCSKRGVRYLRVVSESKNLAFEVSRCLNNNNNNPVSSNEVGNTKKRIVAQYFTQALGLSLGFWFFWFLGDIKEAEPDAAKDLYTSDPQRSHPSFVSVTASSSVLCQIFLFFLFCLFVAFPPANRTFNDIPA